MASSYMELIYIDGADARKTDLIAELMTDRHTWAAFNRYRRYGVPFDKATFLLDYHNRRGDIAYTIALNNEGFVALTGERPKSAAAYRKIDQDYWRRVRALKSESQANQSQTSG